MVAKGCGKQIIGAEEGYCWYSDDPDGEESPVGWHVYAAGDANVVLTCGRLNPANQPWLCLECGNQAGVMW